ncbi:YSIRK-targeted triacylglycerol lipase [Staphylococcus lutrae]|uniref:YSIRK-targeted triacylglycerol lipase n=1 Tax=Staphylococcus lutrae TaxID=155085 RepID=UPI003CC82C17
MKAESQSTSVGTPPSRNDDLQQSSERQQVSASTQVQSNHASVTPKKDSQIAKNQNEPPLSNHTDNKQPDKKNVTPDETVDGHSTPKDRTAEKALPNHSTVVNVQEKPSPTRAPQPSTPAQATTPLSKAEQAQHINQYPIVLVHGFLGLVDQNAPALYPNYWGGNKFKVVEELRNKGYDIYQASVGAFSSHYDRAVELYYYIKGGRVDYGAAHAARYGHNRYGRTYEGIMPNWAPGKKIHLIGHSMGGQTIRSMETFLRNGNAEEIEYHNRYGGEISPLFLGGLDHMIASITTLGTLHNGSQAADKLANTEFFKNMMFALNRIAGNKNSKIDLGLTQWGFKQQPGESYIDYIQRVSQSPIWHTMDQAAYDLTLEGSAHLNEITSLNPNITYTTYTGAATHVGPLSKENPNIDLYPLMDITSRIIGGDMREEWRKNDGVVPVISSLFPLNQDYVYITADDLATRKGVWQVRPVLEGWDHVDFIGLDATDFKRTGAELADFYMGMVNQLLRVEALDEK